MPSGPPRRPRVSKGAFVEFRQGGQNASNIVLFQYNPEKMTRKLVHPTVETCSDVPEHTRKDLHALMPPSETISLTLELDSTDQLEHTRTMKKGLLPTLSALEMMMYPERYHTLDSPRGQSFDERKQSGEWPTVLFICGASRLIPVRFTDLTVTEEAFDENLNPIRAKIELEMQVLSDVEMERNSVGYNAYVNYIVNKHFISINRRDQTK